MQTSPLVLASRRLPLASSSKTATSARRLPGRPAVRCLQGGASSAAPAAGEVLHPPPAAAAAAAGAAAAAAPLPVWLKCLRRMRCAFHCRALRRVRSRLRRSRKGSPLPQSQAAPWAGRTRWPTSQHRMQRAWRAAQAQVAQRLGGGTRNRLRKSQRGSPLPPNQAAPWAGRTRWPASRHLSQRETKALQVGASCCTYTHSLRASLYHMYCGIQMDTSAALTPPLSMRAGGSAAEAGGSGQELDVDAALRGAIRPLLQHTRRGLAQHPGAWAWHAGAGSTLV